MKNTIDFLKNQIYFDEITFNKNKFNQIYINKTHNFIIPILTKYTIKRSELNSTNQNNEIYYLLSFQIEYSSFTMHIYIDCLINLVDKIINFNKESPIYILYSIININQLKEKNILSLKNSSLSKIYSFIDYNQSNQIGIELKSSQNDLYFVIPNPSIANLSNILSNSEILKAIEDFQVLLTHKKKSLLSRKSILSKYELNDINLYIDFFIYCIVYDLKIIKSSLDVYAYIRSLDQNNRFLLIISYRHLNNFHFTKFSLLKIKNISRKIVSNGNFVLFSTYKSEFKTICVIDCIDKAESLCNINNINYLNSLYNDIVNRKYCIYKVKITHILNAIMMKYNSRDDNENLNNKIKDNSIYILKILLKIEDGTGEAIGQIYLINSKQDNKQKYKDYKNEIYFKIMNVDKEKKENIFVEINKKTYNLNKREDSYIYYKDFEDLLESNIDDNNHSYFENLYSKSKLIMNSTSTESINFTKEVDFYFKNKDFLIKNDFYIEAIPYYSDYNTYTNELNGQFNLYKEIFNEYVFLNGGLIKTKDEEFFLENLKKISNYKADELNCILNKMIEIVSYVSIIGIRRE